MAEGLTLKGWKVGKKLGAGACSDVYEGTERCPTVFVCLFCVSRTLDDDLVCVIAATAEPVVPLAGSDARGRTFVIKVSPLPQIPAAKLKNKKRKKTLAERRADALYAEHLLYKNHLRDHPGIPFVPAGAYGEDKVRREWLIHRKSVGQFCWSTRCGCRGSGSWSWSALVARWRRCCARMGRSPRRPPRAWATTL